MNMKLYYFFDRLMIFALLFIMVDFSYSIIKFQEININHVEVDWIRILIFAIVFTLFKNEESNNTGFLKNKHDVRILIWLTLILIVLGIILDLWLNKKLNFYYLFISIFLFELSIIFSLIISVIYWRVIKRLKREE